MKNTKSTYTQTKSNIKRIRTNHEELCQLESVKLHFILTRNKIRKSNEQKALTLKQKATSSASALIMKNCANWKV